MKEPVLKFVCLLMFGHLAFMTFRGPQESGTFVIWIYVIRDRQEVL